MARPVTVLFSGTGLRQRRRETIAHPPPGIRFRTIDGEEANRLGEDAGKASVTGVRRLWTTNNLIAGRFLKGVDLVYSPGFPVMTDIPYVVEIDNVSILAYYRLGLLRAFKPLLRHLLRSERCRGIICLSEAAKRSVERFFADTHITGKCAVVYPYAGPVITRKPSPKTIRFLFVANVFALKGGKEVVHAFERVQSATPQARLTIVTRRASIDAATLMRIERNPAITLIESTLTKQELHRQHFAKADVFVLPSYMDSFGMVYLEALKAGLPIIATDVFAIPEMVENSVNGITIPSPIPVFVHDLPNRAWWNKDIAAYAARTPFPAVERALVDAMTGLAQDATMRKRMTRASRALFERKFSEKTRISALGTVLGGGVHVRH